MTWLSEMPVDERVELAAEVERLRAELADVREDMGFVERERDELRGAVTAHRLAVRSRAGPAVARFDRELWAVLDR